MHAVMVWARRVWEADAREWHLPDRWTLALAVIPVVIALAGILAVPFRPAYRLLANEDGITEWLQVVLIVVCLLAYVRIGWVLWRSGHRALALLFFTGAAGMFFVGGEEISWGQRIFGWATPDVLEDINNQGESNIHNIGPLLRIFNLVVLAVSLAAIVAPLARWTIWRERLRGVAGYLFVPPVALIPAFGFAFAYRAIRLLFLPEPDYVLSKYAEFAELSFYFGLAVFAIVTLRVLRSGIADR